MSLRYKTIGIPRAFYFHSFPGLFETFFQLLGIETVISPPSDKHILQAATNVCEAEHCLPNKLFDGHVLSIADRVDAVLVPRVISMTRGYIACPRFGALPEATRAWLRETPQVLTFDINETKEPLQRSLRRLAVKLGCSSREGKFAATKAIEAMNHRLTDLRSTNISSGSEPEAPLFLVLGHSYTLHDKFIATPILQKLRSMKVGFEVMSFDDSLAPPKGTPRDILWCTFAKMYNRLTSPGASLYAGVIQLTTFNCGCDSMMMERFRRLCRKRDVPYMILMVDEHTGRAGIDTRLEAFVDSISWREAAGRNGDQE
ncbi:MAG: hypothetical protein JXX29_06340 [Deltaproteobacteria bacterium]|nr:hypothetical protein [Deltaproteobacteria bacterium]MBN2671270.1 hypothetical protein [Deltaproteobacteria bacterium]